MTPAPKELACVFDGCLTERLAPHTLPPSVADGALVLRATAAAPHHDHEGWAWQLFAKAEPETGGMFIPCDPAIDATCCIAMAADDFLALGRGDLNLQMAFMKGRIKVTGDVGCAMALGALFG